jgi:hypothetical protein
MLKAQLSLVQKLVVSILYHYWDSPMVTCSNDSQYKSLAARLAVSMSI